MTKTKLILFLYFFTHKAALGNICILVHGTWAHKENWHKPSSIEYETLKNILAKEDISLISFNWSGVLSYKKRKVAGQRLAALINSYPEDTKFTIISHSHGGNVGIIASQLLTNKNQIKDFYALGTPIDVSRYLPNMNVIQSFYNIFSFGDIYQTVLGFHQRIFPNNDRIWNINIEINGKKPQHEDLHCTTVLKYLPKLSWSLTSFENTCPMTAKFKDKFPPLVFIDLDFKEKMESDYRLHQMINLNLLGNYMVLNSRIKLQPHSELASESTKVSASSKCNLPA